MKKRILSLLLTVLMLVSAFSVLFIGAEAEAPEPEYPVVDYESLYVTSGLMYQYDFFKSNAYWNFEGENPEDYLQPETTDTTNADKLMEKYRIAGTRFFNIQIRSSALSGDDKTVYDFKEGYIQFFSNRNANDYISLSQFADETSPRTLQYICNPGTVINKNTMAYCGVALGFTTADSDNYKVAAGTYYTGATMTGNKEIPFPKDTVADFTLTYGGLASAVGVSNSLITEPITYAIKFYRNNDVLVNGTWTIPTGSNYNTIRSGFIGWSCNSDMALYAVRLYNRVLSPDEIALNHFADICKWYRLDPGVYVQMTDDEKVDIALSFTDVTVGGAATRDEVQASVTDTVKSTYYGVLLEDTTNPGVEEFFDIALEVDADITTFLSLPIEYRQNVYDAVISLENRTTENVNLAINAAVQDVVYKYYKDYLVETDMNYLQLYVKQDNMIVWGDFFNARAIDGNVYTDVSYDYEGKTLNTEVSYKDYAVSHKSSDPIPSNSNEFFQKYFYINFQGAFKLYDIEDRNNYYKHTNIRTYGDKCLIGGLNNSVRLNVQAAEDDITYQFVFSGGGGSVQLDGFRTTLSVRGGVASLAAPSYYGFGPNSADATQTTTSANVYATGNGSLGTMGTAMDLTMVVDKNVGTDAGHFYRVQFKTDSDGRLASRFYLMPDETQGLLNKPDNELKYYEQTVEAFDDSADPSEKLYLVKDRKVVASKLENVYFVKSSNTTNSEDLYFYPYPQDDGSIEYKSVSGNTWFKCLNPDAKDPKYVDANGVEYRLATKYLLGTGIEEVWSDLNAEDVYGPVSYYGRMNLSVYGDGVLAASYIDLPYQVADVGSFGNTADNTLYAVRGYNCALTQEDIAQNHFADLAGYYDFDLTFFSLLSEKQRKELYQELLSLKLGGEKSIATSQYKDKLAEILYDFDTPTPEAQNFLNLCKAFSLDVTSLLELSPESRQNVFEVFAGVSATSRNFTAILQKELEEAIMSELSANYAMAKIHTVLTFDNWEVHLSGDPAMRAKYTLNQSMVELLESRGITVRAGVLTVPSNKVGSADEVEVWLEGNTVKATTGATVSVAYNGTAFAESEDEGNASRFVVEASGVDYTIANELYPDESKYNTKYYSLGFVILSEGGKDDIVYTVKATVNGSSTACSLYSLCKTGRQNMNWSYEAVNEVLAAMDDNYDYIFACFGHSAMSDLRVSADTINVDAVRNLNKVMREITDVTFGSVADYGEGRGVMFYGKKNLLNSTGRFYGITVQNDSLYIWYSDDRDAEVVLDLFEEILNEAYYEGEDFYLPNGFEIVRKTRED